MEFFAIHLWFESSFQNRTTNKMRCARARPRSAESPEPVRSSGGSWFSGVAPQSLVCGSVAHCTECTRCCCGRLCRSYKDPVGRP
jgi:hypothetical protein